jgi:F-type H+-transporting ATPase subunit b
VPHTPAAACELKRKLGAVAIAVFLLAMPALAQEHAPTPGATEEHAAEGEHASPFSGLFWPTANFAIMVGVLVYFLKPMLTTYLADRSSTIRKDLVEAAALKATATEQLAAIERKLQALPGELDALRARGAEEIASEDQRIAAAAAADRDRLLAQARHEIDLQVRLAKRDILEHAADLSVQLATERLKKEITPADQARLVEQYLAQVKDRT